MNVLIIFFTSLTNNKFAKEIKVKNYCKAMLKELNRFSSYIKQLLKLFINISELFKCSKCLENFTSTKANNTLLLSQKPISNAF